MRHRKNRVAEEMEEDEAEKKRSREEEKREETQEPSEKKRTRVKEIGRWKDKERTGDSDGGKRERAWERQKQREKF